MANFAEMREALASTGRSVTGRTVLEIGTGWFPTIPILLCLDGARLVYMSDLVPHMDDVTFGETLSFLRKSLPDGHRLMGIERPGDLPLKYLAPFDPTSIPDASIDLVVSRTVLEHIPPESMRQLLAALRPKLSPGGTMVHLVDHSDHLEHADKSISKIHFLTWSSRKHAFINWLMREGENRLRHHEYPALFERAGYRVIRESSYVHEQTIAAARTLRLAEPFASMPPDRLAIMTSVFVLVPGVTSQ